MNSNIRTLNISTFILLLLTFVVFAYGCKAAPQVKVVEPSANESLEELDEYLDMIINTTEDFQASTLNMLIEDYFKEEDRLLQKKYGYHEKLKKLFDAGRIKTAPVEPRADHSTLIKKLQSLSTRYQARATMEGVNYSIGYALFESGRYDEAMAAFEGFISQYPSSRHATEVSFRLGEMYFEDTRLIEAEEAYARVLKDDRSVFYDKALYKTGWTHYRLDEFQEAVDYFLRLIERPEESGFAEASAKAIKEEAFENTVKSLTHMEIPNEVRRELRKIKSTEVGERVIMMLGQVLSEQTRHREALKTYSLFEELFEGSPLRAKIYAMRGVTHEKLGEDNLATDIDESIVELFNPSTEWYVEHFNGDADDRKKNAEAKAYTDAIVSEILMTTATTAHNDARLSRSTNALEDAISTYRRVIEYYPVSDTAKKARLLLAEALFDGGRYSEATAMNEEIVALYETSPEAEAAAMNILSGIELTIKTPTYDRTKVFKTISTTEILLRKNYQGNTKLEGLLYRISALYIDLEDYEKARVILSELTEGTSPALAYKMIGDISVWENNESSAIMAYDKAIGYGTNVEVEKKLSEMYYVMAMRLEEEGNENEALTHYFKTSTTMPGSRQAKDALKRAGYIYIKDRDIGGLRTIIDMVEKNHPASRTPFNLLVEAGKGFEEDKSMVQAAKLFEEAAIAASENSPFDANRLALKAAEVLSTAGENKRLAELLKRQIGDKNIAEQSMQRALYMLGKAYMDDGQERAGIKRLRQSIEAGSNETPFALKARSTLADIRLEEYLLLRITSPFEKTLKKKEAFMVELLGEYKAIIKGASTELLAKGFYSIGVLFEDFRTALIESERPKGLSTTELEEYDFLIEERAYPLEEEAVEAFKASLKASLKASGKGTNLFTTKAIEKLSLLRPALYDRSSANGTPVRPIFIEPRMIEVVDFSTKESSAIEDFKRGVTLLKESSLAESSLTSTAILREAVKSFALAIALAPDFTEAHYGLGLTLLRLGDLKSAKKELMSTLRSPLKIPEAYNALAIIYVKEDNIKEAVNSLIYAIALKANVEYMINLGNLYLLDRESAYALAQYGRAEEIDSSNVHLNYNMALALLEEGRAEEAQEKLDNLSSIKNARNDINTTDLESTVAITLVATGDVKEALITFTDIAAKNRSLAEPNKYIGIIYEIYLENFDMAVVHYLKYIALNGKEAETVRKWADIAKERGGAR